MISSIKTCLEATGKALGFADKGATLYMGLPSQGSLKTQHTCPLCGAGTVQPLYTIQDFDVVRCRQCGLVFSTLSVDRDALEKLYSDKYFQTRQEYFFQNPIMNSSITEEGATIQNFRFGLSLINRYGSKGRLLDVGCAVGVFLSLARQQGWKTYGVDISQYAASHCREVLGHEAFVGDLKEVQFPDRWFDVVTLWDVLEHFPDPASQLREVYRILKKDGIILIDTPNEESLLRWLARMIFLVSKGKILYPVRKLYHHFHLYYFTPRTLQMLLKKSGFSLIHLEKKCIPLVKARGRLTERLLVKAISFPERILNKEYELLGIAKKVD